MRTHRAVDALDDATCQSAQADGQITSSVAAELMAAGIGSVVAMSLRSCLRKGNMYALGALAPAPPSPGLRLPSPATRIPAGAAGTAARSQPIEALRYE
jgi:hypothetical protein